MKFQRTHLLRLGAVAILAMRSAVAAPVTPPADGDIFLGFRASDGLGSGVSLIINVGNNANFRNASEGSLLNLASVGADVAAVYGANWHTRGDLHWGFFGAQNVVNPPVYASRAQTPVGYPAPLFNALPSNARTSTKTKIVSVITAYQGLQSTAGNPVAAVQVNSAVDGSYNHQITGGTTSFGSLSQWTNIEGNFGSGAAKTALDLFSLSGSQAEGNVVSRLGTFKINSSGALSFERALAVGVAGIRLAQAAYSVNEDAGVATLTFQRTNDVSAAVTASYSTSNGTAEAGTDYTEQSGTVSFAAGQITKTVEIPILRRSGVSASRAFTVNVSAPSTGAVVLAYAASTEVTIQDVDKEVQFTASSLSIAAQDASNNPNTLLVEVSRAGLLGDAASVDVAVTGGSLASNYYTFTNPTKLNFDAEESSATASLLLNEIPLENLPATLVLSLSNPEGASLGARQELTVTVKANPGQISFAAASFNAPTTSSSVEVRLQRVNGSAGVATVNVLATSDTLVNETHYRYTSPTVVTFPEDETEAVTTIEILSDAIPGTIELTLANASELVTLGEQSSASVVLTSEPGVISFAGTSGNVREEDGQIVIPLVRTGGSSGAVSVTVRTENGSAISPGDYTAVDTVVNFADEQESASVTIPIIADNVRNEANEVFYVNLSNPVNTTVGQNSRFEVRILDLDSSAPTVTITEPKANAKVAANNDSQVTVKGSAKDNKGVATVEVKINGGSYVAALLSAGSKGAVNYQLPVTVGSGINVLTVRSTDHRGNVSKEVVRTFTYDDPYPVIAGVYTGLVSASGTTIPSNSTEGLISVTVASKGTFSGKLTIDGFALSFSGSAATGGEGLFGKTLTSSASLTRKGKPTPLVLKLQFDLAKTGNSYQVTGSVVDGSIESELVANRSLYTNKKNPVLPLRNPDSSLVASYTVLFKAATAGAPNPEASAFPQGDGWGRVVVSNAGVAKVTGALADGTAITFSAPLSSTNRLPFFTQLYKKKGSISGPVKFENLTATDLDGEELFWFRPADTKSKVYPGGWPTGITTNLIGSKFIKAAKGDAQSVLGYASNATLSFTQGTLVDGINKSVSITAANKVTKDSADKSFKLSVAGATGIFSGSFTAPAPQKKPAFKGVVLQKSGEASGFFLSTALSGSPSQSGKVTLTPAQ